MRLAVTVRQTSATYRTRTPAARCSLLEVSRKRIEKGAVTATRFIGKETDATRAESERRERATDKIVEVNGALTELRGVIFILEKQETDMEEHVRLLREQCAGVLEEVKSHAFAGLPKLRCKRLERTQLSREVRSDI